MTAGQQWAYVLLGATAAFILASVALAVLEAAIIPQRERPGHLMFTAATFMGVAFLGLTGLTALGLGGVQL